MTIHEFSDAFDVALSSYIRLPEYAQQFSGTEIALNEYEKSLFLTKAQEEIVKALYNGLAISESFEKTEAIRRQLDSLVKEKEYTGLTKELQGKFNHSKCTLPTDCWYVIYEQVTTTEFETTCESEIKLDVYPTTHDEYQRIVKNPFRGPNSRRVLRLDVGKLQVELISTLEVGKYFMRYISKPTPIVLCDLTADGIKIEGKDTPTECALNEVLHQDILDRAVQLALTSRLSQNKVQK